MGATSSTTTLHHRFSPYKNYFNQGQKVKNGKNRKRSSSEDSLESIRSMTKEMDCRDQEHYLYRRLFAQHWLMQKLHESLRSHLASGNKRCLDIGHGTGVWVLEMAAEFPDAHFYGVDTVNLHPRLIHPLNVKFIIDNGLPFDKGFFTFVRQQNYTTWRSEALLTSHFTSIRQVMENGGVLQVCECSGIINDCGPAGAQLNTWWAESMRDRGVNTALITELLPALVENAGFSKVRSCVDRMPVGAWGGVAGEEAILQVKALMERLRPANVSHEEFIAAIESWRTEANSMQAWMEVVHVVACK